MTCVSCLNAAPIDAARFCVYCGWPLVQECPYEGCSATVPLTTGTGPTVRCPECQRPFKVCEDPHCGRLHRYAVNTCECDHDKTLYEPMHGWPLFGGNPARTSSILLKKPLRTGTAWEADFVTASLPMRIGPMVAAAGEVVFTAGASLQVWRPGVQATRSPGNLGTVIPSEPWRMMIAGGSIYCVGEDALHAVPIGNGAFKGESKSIIAQGTIGGKWLGVRRDGLQLSCEIRSTDKGLEASFPLGKVPQNVVQPLALDEEAWLISEKGRVWRINEARADEIGSLELDYVRHAAILDRKIYAVGPQGSAVHVAAMHLDGTRGVNHPIPGLIDVATPPMALAGKLVLAASQPDRIFTIDPLTLSVLAEPTHGFLEVTQAVLIQAQNGPFAALLGREHNRKVVALVNTDTGFMAGQVFQASTASSLGMIVADGMLFVSHSQDQENKIRAYKL